MPRTRKQYNTIVLPLYQGFIDEENQITCYTDHQIFERYHKFNIKTAIRKTEYHLKELTTLSVGDYVTHIDHGIGRFGGLQKNTGREQNTGSYKTGLC
jgi:transcription-repair coupling factor (superfamily II helicase)